MAQLAHHSPSFNHASAPRRGASAPPRVAPRATLRHWLFLAAALDIAVTTVILHLGGTEVNRVAAWALAHLGELGLVLVKVVSLAVVLAACHLIARHSQPLARHILRGAIAVTCVPVVYGLGQLALLIYAERDQRVWDAIIFQADLEERGARSVTGRLRNSRDAVGPHADLGPALAADHGSADSFRAKDPDNHPDTHPATGPAAGPATDPVGPVLTAAPDADQP